jgi:hypothetical protein
MYQTCLSGGSSVEFSKTAIMICMTVRSDTRKFLLLFKFHFPVADYFTVQFKKNDRILLLMVDCPSPPDSHPSEQASASLAPRSKPHAKFSASEDAHLRSLLRLYGPADWSLIAEHIPEKTTRQ